MYDKTEKIKWTDKVPKEDVLERVNEERAMLIAIPSWIGAILRRNVYTTLSREL